MKILTHVFDLIFPPRATEVLLRNVTAVDCKNKFLPQLIQNTICLSPYKDPLLSALVTENKFYGSEMARKHLSTLLLMWVHAQTAPVVLIPIPLSTKRERERGYNQVTVVLEALKNDASICIDTDLLVRSRHTTAQTTLKREERLKNLTSAFSCDAEKIQLYQNCTLVIVDDVLTTGATMIAAKAVLLPHIHPSTTLLSLALAH